MFGPLAGKVKLNHWLVAVAVISVYSVSAGYKEAPLKKEPASKPESQDRTPVVQDFRYSNVAPRDGLEARPSTVPGAAIGSSSWKTTLFRRRPLGGGGLTVAGAGRFLVFSSESLFKVGKRLCGKAHIVHKRKPPLSGGVVGGWWRGRPGTTQTTQPISFVFCNHDAQ